MDGQKRVFDISKPGATPATPSSRPVIPNSQPVTSDPMFTGSAPQTPQPVAAPVPVPQPAPTPTPLPGPTDMSPAPVQISNQQSDPVHKLSHPEAFFGHVGSRNKGKKRALGIFIAILLIAGAVGAYMITKNKPVKKAESSTQVTAPVSNKKEATTKTAETAIPEGYLEYKDAELLFSFLYPKAWLSKAETKLTVTKTKTADYVFNDQGFDNPTYFDATTKQWYTKKGQQKEYISKGKGIELQEEVKGQTFWVFLGKGALYCGGRDINFVVKENMISLRASNVCSEDAKKDPDPIWNTQTYFETDFVKDLNKFTASYQNTAQ